MNPYILNPPAVNIFKDAQIVKTIVFIGSAPKSVVSSLQAGNLSAASLKKFYGPSWRARLHINDVKGGDEDKSGGSFEIDLDKEFSQILQETSREKEEKVQMKKSKRVVEYSSISIYPEDSVFQVKQKIYMAAKIPPYAQFLWMENDNFDSQLGYNIFIGNRFMRINAKNVWSDKEKVHGIPIMSNFYNSKEEVKVEALDTFQLIESFTTRFGNNEINLANLLDFITDEVKSDTSSHETIYHGFVVMFWPMTTEAAFKELVVQGGDIGTTYSRLCPNMRELEKRYAIEKKIIDSDYELVSEDSAEMKRLYKNTRNSITYSLFNNISTTIPGEVNISIRNAFDSVVLSEKYPAAKAVVKFNHNAYILHKVFAANDRIEKNISQQHLNIQIQINSDEYAYFVLYPSGNYLVHAFWREENKRQVEEVSKILTGVVNDLVEKLNKFGSEIFISHRKLRKMDTSSRGTTKLTELSMSIFFMRQIDDAGFDKLQEMLTEHTKAGMMTFKQREGNVIEYFFNKAVHQYDHTRIDKVIQLSNYYTYLTDQTAGQKWQTLFEKTRLTRVIHRSNTIKFEVSSIKEAEFTVFQRTIYGICRQIMTIKNNGSSQLSAKKLQNLKDQDPKLYKGFTYSTLCQKPFQPVILKPDDDTRDAFKFWNFTTEEPVWYSCPNPKYPYIKFIVNRHPKKFCIPCCKKKPYEPGNEVSRICTSKYCYETEKKTKNTKYVMGYGKDVSEGRLSKLPPPLEELFKRANTSSLFLFGVSQSNNLGVVYSLELVVDMEIDEIFERLAAYIRRTSIFHTLLGGRLKHLVTEKQLLDWFEKTGGNEAVSRIGESVNTLLIELIKAVFGVHTIVFEEDGGIVDTWISPYMKSAIDITGEKYNMILVKKEENYYPIVSLNLDDFFRKNIIKQKTYQRNESIMQLILDMTARTIKNTSVARKFDIVTIRAFVGELENLQMFTTMSGLIYYIGFKYAGHQIFIPIMESIHSGATPGRPFLRAEHKIDYKSVNSFINNYNKYASKSGSIFITPDTSLVLGEKVIGVRAGNLNFYCSGAPMLDKKFIVRYDPDIVAVSIKSPAVSSQQQKMGPKYYQYYEYKLFLQEFLSIVSKERNEKTRETLTRAFKEYLPSKLNKLYELTAQIKYREDVAAINKMVLAYMTHRDKNQLQNEFNGYVFKFDKSVIQKVHMSSQEQAEIILKKIMKPRIEIGEGATITSNMLGSCEGKNSDLCKSGKLILSATKYQEYISVLAADIINPLKVESLFSILEQDPVIYFFNFIRRPMETLLIETM